jgi:predicted phage terminase large subunit-like protein
VTKLQQRARNSLAAYGSAVWPKFELAPHHRKLVEALQRCEDGTFDRLIITFPPRHGKSAIASQIFPAWFLGLHPELSIISASYGAELATDFGRRVRNYVASEMHLKIFPQCIIADDSNAVHRFNTTAGGSYFALGSGGAVTGRGGDLIILDDLIKSNEEAGSSAYRRNLQSWFESVLYPRLEPGGRLVIVSTRWHENDLIGWLLKEHSAEAWKVLNFTAIAEEHEGWRQPGEALWPARFPLDALMRIKAAIGSASWTALYQGRPAPAEGNIFHREWFRRYSQPPADIHRIAFSLDTAFKTSTTSDYSVVMVIGENRTGYHILHVARARLEFPALQEQVRQLAGIWHPHAVLVEDHASGQSLIQSLQSDTRLPILPVKSGGVDKISRAAAAAPMVEAGRVYLPTTAPWLADFEDELASFPVAQFDDQVDSLVQFLNWARGNSPTYEWTPAPNIRTLAGSPMGPGLSGSSGMPNRLYCTGEEWARQEDSVQMHVSAWNRRHGRRSPSVQWWHQGAGWR